MTTPKLSKNGKFSPPKPLSVIGADGKPVAKPTSFKFVSRRSGTRGDR